MRLMDIFVVLYCSVAACYGVSTMSSLIHCSHVCVVSFDIVVNSRRDDRAGCFAFSYFLTFKTYFITCFVFLLVPLEGYDMSQLMSLWYLSHRRPAKAQATLRIRAVSPEPSLFAHMKYGSR